MFIPRFQLNILRSCIVQQRNVKKNSFSTWSMSPTFPAISSSGRQRKPRGPTLYCKETSTCGKKVFESLGTKMKNKYHITNQKNHMSRNKYHITLQELPRTSPNVSSKHERPTVDVNLFNKKLKNCFFHSYGKSVTPKNESKVILFTITGSCGL